MNFLGTKSNRIKWCKTVTRATALLLILGFTSIGYASNFPHRKDFPSIPPINSEDLIKDYEAGSAIIVDVRSKI